MGNILNNKTRYKLDAENYAHFILPEYRALTYKFSDPLSLCFKLLIDWDKPSGLLANESNVNSALAYLKRIGELNRYELLKKWIEVFGVLVRNYDFLLMEVEGLDQVMNSNPNHMFTGNDEEKITLNFRETKDMLVQSLISMYRSIWFDDVRCVEVLPSNLRKFDISILIYSAGYYNMFLYDVMTEADMTDTNINIDRQVLPTLRKLSDDYFYAKNPNGLGFNNILINFGSCEILVTESGKNFISKVSNEMSDDMVMNDISFDFKTASHIGAFNNIFGNFNITELLALSAAQDRANNEDLEEVLYGDMVRTNKKLTYKDTVKAVKSNVKNYLSTAKTALKTVFQEELERVKAKPDQYLNALLSPLSPVGNAFMKLTDANEMANMVKNTADLGIQKIDDFANDKIAKINNLVLRNFSDNFIDIYKNYFADDKQSSNIGLIQNDKKTETANGVYYNAQQADTVEKGIKFSNDNIYNRRGF